MNQTIYNVLLGITGLVAVLFILLVFRRSRLNRRHVQRGWRRADHI